MARRQPITVVGYLIKPECVNKDVRDLKKSDVTPIEDLTPEEKAKWMKEATARTKRIMSEYYLNHPEHYELLPDAD